MRADLLRNEARLQADLRVATMPDDLDPDEIVARDKEEWAKLIENAKAYRHACDGDSRRGTEYQ